jgi:hypothetical protein
MLGEDGARVAVLVDPRHRDDVGIGAMCPAGLSSTTRSGRLHALFGSAYKASAAFQTCLTWRDPDGSSQSKLPLTKPETVIAIAVRGEIEPNPERKPRSRRTSRAMPQAETLDR